MRDHGARGCTDDVRVGACGRREAVAFQSDGVRNGAGAPADQALLVVQRENFRGGMPLGASTLDSSKVTSISMWRGGAWSAAPEPAWPRSSAQRAGGAVTVCGTHVTALPRSRSCSRTRRRTGLRDRPGRPCIWGRTRGTRAERWTRRRQQVPLVGVVPHRRRHLQTAIGAEVARRRVVSVWAFDSHD